MKIGVSLFCLGSLSLLFGKGHAAYSQSDEKGFLDNYDSLIEHSYHAVGDDTVAPRGLVNECGQHQGGAPSHEVRVTGSTVSASQVQSQCGANSICVIPEGTTLNMDGNLNVGAMKIRGALQWTESTQGDTPVLYLCGGYIVVEKDGSFNMELLSHEKQGWIYIKNNGAEHPTMKTRAFAADATPSADNDYHGRHDPRMTISGYPLTRTWSLLSQAIRAGATEMKLLHNPTDMGWKVGDRLGLAPTAHTSSGWGEAFKIAGIADDGTVTLDAAAEHGHGARFEGKALMSAEVVNLSRNIVITGDDHENVDCEDGLPEAVAGEGTSVDGCKCNQWRHKCTKGLHTGQFHGGIVRIQNIRVEKCGQRGIEGKYCLHLHQAHNCPDCFYKNNAIESSMQRGIIIHGTHHSLVEGNVMYNVRGAGVYVEDGNEMWNTISYNVDICPFPFIHHAVDPSRSHTVEGAGCTIPGTSNRLSDTSDNQSGFYFHGAPTNNLIGNRAASTFNGMFLQGGEHGRGHVTNRVCCSSNRLGRFQGNTFHSNGRFGTYALGDNYPKETDQSVDRDGLNDNQDLCFGFDGDGNARGLAGAFIDHVDYGNAFVGHYMAGDLQHRGHHATENNNNIYWKETKNFKNGCGAHLMSGYYGSGNMALPDQATFIMENTVFGPGAQIEACHHCNVGSEGFLCQPQYILHNVRWLENGGSGRNVFFQDDNTQITHASNQNYGGIFALSPPNARTVMGGGQIPDSFLPDGFVSFVSHRYTYLLDRGVPDNLGCETSEGRKKGNMHNGGILCKAPLRALKVYSRGQSPGARTLRVEIWFNESGNRGRGTGSADVTAEIPFHLIGSNNGSKEKQGYSLPIFPGTEKTYRVSLAGRDLPDDWVIEFSDPVMGNRWEEEHIYLIVKGRTCANNGLVSSQHDRKWIYSGEQFMGPEGQAWGNHGACPSNGAQPDNPTQSCDASNPGSIDGSCPEMCNPGCSMNAYCDCGTGTCLCEPGFSGSNCEDDICSSANCGEHGRCPAKYLGGTLVPAVACICEEGWDGPRCDQPHVMCGCSSCASDLNLEVHDSRADTCGARINWLTTDQGYTEEDACRRIGTATFRVADGRPGTDQAFCAACNPDACGGVDPNAPAPQAPANQAPAHEAPASEPDIPCGCSSCTPSVLNHQATDSGGDPGPTCGKRMQWLRDNRGYDWERACREVGGVEWQNGGSVCGGCNPDTCSSGAANETPEAPQAEAPETPQAPQPPPRCGCRSCTDAVWSRVGNGYSCGSRVEWARSHSHPHELDACRLVANEQSACAACNPDTCDSDSRNLRKGKH